MLRDYHALPFTSLPPGSACAQPTQYTLEHARAAKVGHIVATLKQAGRQHTLVVERDAKGQTRLRGIFSTTQVARQLGVDLQFSAAATPFRKSRRGYPDKI